jgi:predicted dehydrogenase
MIRIGIIGTGGMARQHADNFKAIKSCRVVACADIMPGRAKEFADKHGIPAAYEDVEEMLKNEKLDGVSVVTIDAAHAPASLAAIRRKINVMCEKPLADSVEQASKMVKAAKSAGVLTAVNFSYRNRPATQMAASLVASGKLGDIRHVEGEYLQSWLTLDWQVEPSLLWRLSKRHGSAGVLGDLGVHLLDLISFVVGDLESLACDLTIFDKGVKRIGDYVFDVNDSVSALVRFKNGARGTLNTTRWAKGRGNAVALRVYGTKGALDLDLDRPEEEQLKVCLGRGADASKWVAMKCPKTPNQHERFVTSIRTGKQGQTSFELGLKIQKYLQACLDSSENKTAWTKV